MKPSLQPMDPVLTDTEWASFPPTRNTSINPLDAGNIYVSNAYKNKNYIHKSRDLGHKLKDILSEFIPAIVVCEVPEYWETSHISRAITIAQKDDTANIIKLASLVGYFNCVCRA